MILPATQGPKSAPRSHPGCLTLYTQSIVELFLLPKKLFNSASLFHPYYLLAGLQQLHTCSDTLLIAPRVVVAKYLLLSTDLSLPKVSNHPKVPLLWELLKCSRRPYRVWSLQPLQLHLAPCLRLLPALQTLGPSIRLSLIMPIPTRPLHMHVHMSST